MTPDLEDPTGYQNSFVVVAQLLKSDRHAPRLSRVTACDEGQSCYFSRAIMPEGYVRLIIRIG
jgi:hypothetical protein